MLNLRNYITEKLVINRDVQIVKYERGDGLCLVWIDDIEDEDTGHMWHRLTINFLGYFIKFENSTLYYKDKSEQKEQEWGDNIMNKNHFIEGNDKDAPHLVLPLEASKDFAKKMLKMSSKEFIDKELYKYFENKIDMELITTKFGDKSLKKTLTKINDELKKLHN